MATEVDTLVFSLLLDSSGFKKGEKTALGAIKNIRNAFISTNMLIAGFQVLGSIISDFKQLNLQMGDLSRRTGNSTQALEKWTRAAKSMGKTGDQVLSDISRISTEFNTPEGRVSLISKASRIGLPALEGRGAKDASDLLIRIAEASRNKFPKPEERAAALKTYMGLSDETIDVMLNFKDLRSSLADFQAVIDNESIAAAREMAKAQFELTDSLKRASFAVGKDSIPLFRKLTQAFNAPSLENSAIAAEELVTTSLNVLTLGLWRKERDTILRSIDDVRSKGGSWWRPGKERSEEWAAALDAPLLKPDGKWWSPKDMRILDTAFASSLVVQGRGYGYMLGDKALETAAPSSFRVAGKKLPTPGAQPVTRAELAMIAKNNAALNNIFKGVGYKLPGNTHPETVEAVKAAFSDTGIPIERILPSHSFTIPEIGPSWIRLPSSTWNLTTDLSVPTALGASYLNRDVTVDSPQYTININSSGDPAAIAGAAKSGVQQANNNLARTLAGNMSNMSYSGSGPGYNRRGF